MGCSGHNGRPVSDSLSALSSTVLGWSCTGVRLGGELGQDACSEVLLCGLSRGVQLLALKLDLTLHLAHLGQTGSDCGPSVTESRPTLNFAAYIPIVRRGVFNLEALAVGTGSSEYNQHSPAVGINNKNFKIKKNVPLWLSQEPCMNCPLLRCPVTVTSSSHPLPVSVSGGGCQAPQPGPSVENLATMQRRDLAPPPSPPNPAFLKCLLALWMFAKRRLWPNSFHGEAVKSKLLAAEAAQEARWGQPSPT